MKYLSLLLLLFSISACAKHSISEIGPRNYSITNGEKRIERHSHEITEKILTPLINGTYEGGKNIVIAKMTFDDHISPRNPSNLVVCLNSHNQTITTKNYDLDCDTVSAVQHDPYRKEKEDTLPIHEYWRAFETDAPQFAFDAFRYTYQTDASDAYGNNGRVLNATRWKNLYFLLKNINYANFTKQGDIVYAGHFHFAIGHLKNDKTPMVLMQHNNDFEAFQTKVKALEKAGKLNAGHQLGQIHYIPLDKMLNKNSSIERKGITTTETTSYR